MPEQRSIMTELKIEAAVKNIEAATGFDEILIACFTRVQMRNPLQENKTTSDTASVKGTVSEAVLLFS